MTNVLTDLIGLQRSGMLPKEMFFAPSFLLTITIPWTTLQCNVLQYSAVYCTTLHFTSLNCITLQCRVLHCTALYCTGVQCSEVHCTAVHCSVLQCSTLHCTALQRARLCLWSELPSQAPFSQGQIIGKEKQRRVDSGEQLLWTVFSVQCTVCSVQCTVKTVHRSVNTAQFQLRLNYWGGSLETSKQDNTR